MNVLYGDYGKSQKLTGKAELRESGNGLVAVECVRDNVQLRVNSLFDRKRDPSLTADLKIPLVSLIALGDARYKKEDGTTLTKAQSLNADMAFDSICDLLSGQQGEIIPLVLESGAFWVLPSYRLGIVLTTKDFLGLSPLTPKEKAHLQDQAYRLVGAPGGVDICDLIMMGKVLTINDCAVDKLPPSWRVYVDQASKAAPLFMKLVNGAIIGCEEMYTSSLAPLLRGTTPYIQSISGNWGDWRIIYVNIGSSPDSMPDDMGVTPKNKVFLRVLEEMAAANWIQDNPDDIQNRRYSLSE
jgi:hypothetical protein